jgi:hypothetical protein
VKKTALEKFYQVGLASIDGKKMRQMISYELQHQRGKKKINYMYNHYHGRQKLGEDNPKAFQKLNTTPGEFNNLAGVEMTNIDIFPTSLAHEVDAKNNKAAL